MRRRHLMQAILLLGGSGMWRHVQAAENEKARAYEITLVFNGEDKADRPWLLIANRIFKTADSPALAEFVATMPAGSTVRWDRGCCRFTGVPTDKEVDALAVTCKAQGVLLDLVPAG